MHFFTIGERRYAQFEQLRQLPGLRHAFSLRPADVSARPEASNSFRHANRVRMAADLGFFAERLCYCIQEHLTRIAFIDAATPPGAFEDTDALATIEPDRPLMTFSADCPLVLLYDPQRHVLGLVHSSWRCTVASSTLRLVAALRERYGSDPAHLLAGLGPSAGPCCYEVQNDVFEAARVLPDYAALFPRRNGRLYFDLWRANQAQLLAAGLRPENIEMAGICTMCRTDLFFSYRREGAGCGHFGLMAALTGP